MKRACRVTVMSFALCGVILVGDARAQYPYNRGPSSPYQTPVLSPYFNLANRNNTVAQNYFIQTRPQELYNTDITRLGQQVTANQQSITNLQNYELGTGHPVRFLNYQRYFLNLNATAAGLGSGVGGPGVGAAGMARQGPFGSSQGFGTRPGTGGRTGR
jgi:hypothetical protein